MRTVDTFITWLVDLFMGMPHLVLIMLIAFTLGGGIKGVVVGMRLLTGQALPG